MSIYDEIEIQDMEYQDAARTFYYACPCGDKFFISLDDLLTGEDIARCPSCSLRIRVICDLDELEARYGGGAAEAPPTTDASATIEVQ